jgi:hypothetical protein
MKLVGQSIMGLLKNEVEDWQKKEAPEKKPTRVEATSG